MDTTHNAKYWKEKLELEHHIEGGSFREVYRAGLVLPLKSLSMAHNGDRTAMTSIYFLLEAGDFSALHRIASDELWHFYDGDTLCVYEIEPNGNFTTHLLGKTEGASLMLAIKAGSWFGAKVAPGGQFALCGCTVAPGFDFGDFELAERDSLQRQFPQHSAFIISLTR